MGLEAPKNYKPKDILPNEHWERFAHMKAAGYSYAKAFTLSQDYVDEDGNEIKKKPSPSVAHSAGWKLVQKVAIKKRIDYLRKKRLEKYKDFDKALEAKYKEAVENESYSESNHLTALRDASKFIGKGLENHHHTVEGNINVVNKFVKTDDDNV